MMFREESIQTLMTNINRCINVELGWTSRWRDKKKALKGGLA